MSVVGTNPRCWGGLTMSVDRVDRKGLAHGQSDVIDSSLWITTPPSTNLSLIEEGQVKLDRSDILHDTPPRRFVISWVMVAMARFLIAITARSRPSSESPMTISVMMRKP